MNAPTASATLPASIKGTVTHKKQFRLHKQDLTNTFLQVQDNYTSGGFNRAAEKILGVTAKQTINLAHEVNIQQPTMQAYLTHFTYNKK